MGIIPLSLETLMQHVGLVGGLNGCRMMELGNQQLMCHPDADKPEGSAAKIWFERQGAKHTSIDLNGQLGAIPLDLSQPIEKSEWDDAFDLVTDFCTSEHVGREIDHLYHCRANVHRWCRPGGLMIFMNPKTGHWPDHGFHFFTLQHYERLAQPDACNYRVVRLYEHPTLGNSINGFQVTAVLQKQFRQPFISPKQFAAICEGTVFPQ